MGMTYNKKNKLNAIFVKPLNVLYSRKCTKQNA